MAGVMPLVEMTRLPSGLTARELMRDECPSSESVSSPRMLSLALLR